ncbi:hypothetical protein M3O96_08475 [Aquiflexum sp. TKW24L]|uniref:hypothetical protein n=1 Tax=Aquiflexum sp. TKW24L TaxID=2942212 RepID=UPI0020BEA6B7|nr:hypothetical protein [Aquiflexum sp. TKW24L]MCL6259119.1 hypothetical protein [Aquiflexum sp. TKW24L]
MERNVLIMIAVPIPFFGFVYLNSENPIFFFEIPQLSEFWEYFLLAIGFTFLIAQYFVFHKETKIISTSDKDMAGKMNAFSEAVFKRFWYLFITALIAALGLFLFGNPGYTVAFAITLLFFSIAKPTPDRIIRALKLKGEEKDQVNALKIRI